MTREEAIKELKEDIELYIPLHGTIDDVDRDLPDGRLITALEMGIKALEQEPCEDAVSRQAVLEALNSINGTSELDKAFEAIENLPSVTPTACIAKVTFSKDDLQELVDEKVEELAQHMESRWIPVSERLPKKNEYIGNVCKYYLIQDEYGDMHVAHLSNVGWIPMDSLKAIGNEIIAWRELPQVYVPEINVGNIEESEDKE